MPWSYWPARLIAEPPALVALPVAALDSVQMDYIKWSETAQGQDLHRCCKQHWAMLLWLEAGIREQ